MSLFAPSLENIDLFLEVIGSRQIRYDARSDRFVLDPAPTRTNAVGDELLASMQVFLRHAYMGAAQWPGKKPNYPYAHDPCGSWRLMTNDRAKTKCECGQKGARRKIDIPWHGANRYNRPDAGRKEVTLPADAV